MNIEKVINKYKIKEEFKPVISSFFEMKQCIYNLTDDEITEKIKETMSNIRSIRYSKNIKIEVAYNYVKREIVIGKSISKQIRKGGLNHTIILSIFHELSHLYDYRTVPNAKVGKLLLNGKNIRTIPILREGINPVENNKLKNEKYILLDECINEAKALVLLQVGGVTVPKLKFNQYQELQPVFETLCSVNNMDYLEFLRNIEGKNINEIACIMSKNSGLPTDLIEQYLEIVAECADNISTKADDYVSKYDLSEEDKTAYRENSFKDYEKMYNASKIYIYDVNLSDKDRIYDRLNIIQNKVITTFFTLSDPRVTLANISDESIELDKKSPEYKGKHIAISKMILDSNGRNFLYKTRSMGFIKKLKNKFFNRRLLLSEAKENVELEPEFTKIR